MKNIFFFLICHSYFASSKLIGSNTLQKISSIELQEQDINLTVWVQFRFPTKFQDQELIEALKIVDQFQNDQLIIQLFIKDQSLMNPYFILQNKSKKSYELKRENWTLDWQKISIQRDICFNKLQYFDINMTVTCDGRFNATLFIIKSISFHIYVYDLEQFENEEIIISNIFLIENKYIINTFKDNLVVQLYAKLYRGQDTQIFFSFTIFSSESYLFYQYSKNKVEIFLHSQDNQIYLVKKFVIQGDQWVLFNMEFNKLDIIIQYNSNNTNNIVVVQIDHYLDFSVSQYLDYSFTTICLLLNTKATAIKYLQIISLISTQQKNSCSDDCLFCLYNQCFDQEKPSFDFKISNEIRSSKYYNETYFQNYQVDCDDKRFYIENQNCLEFPKYNGKYCYNCQFFQGSNNYLNDYNQLVLRTYSYDYYLESLFDIQEDYKIEHNGLFLETDLNIYILRDKDIYKTYKLYNQIFCAFGYQFTNKCQKILKKCQQQIQFCLVCQEQYAVVKNKCIRCQKNCLYCRILKNKLICILFNQNYYENNNGLIKQCMKNSDIFICLPKDQAINQLKQKGYKVCQHHEVFDIYTKCQDMKKYNEIFEYLQYYPNYKYEEQLLEIQEILAEQPGQCDQQIYCLIAIQQMNKLTRLIQQQYEMQSSLNMNKNFELLSQMNSSLEQIAIKKITLYDVKIYIQEFPIIIYENKAYEGLIDIYKLLYFQPKIIQYNLILIMHSLGQNLIYNIFIDVDEFPNVNFIFNIQFNFNPSILYQYSNTLYFRADQIIINNLLFDQNNKQFEQNFDETALFQYLFQILSKNITIYNITIQNMELEKLFFLEQFKYFRMYNIMITNSSIQYFIKGIKLSTINQTINISDIYCQRCNLIDFIYFWEAQLIDIYNITYISSQLSGYNFEFNGTIISLNINNLQLIKVSLNKGRLLQARYQDKLKETNFTISNLYLEDSNLINSAFALLQNVDKIQVKQIYMYHLSLQGSILFTIAYITKAHFEKFYFYKLAIQQNYNFIKIEDYNKTTIKDFYFHNFISVKQKLFFLRGIVTLVKNFNFNQINLSVYDLIITESIETRILKLMISNLICAGGLEGTGDTIQIYSQKLTMQGIVFRSGLVNGTQLLSIYSSGKFILKYLYIQNLNIITLNQDQLILFKSILNNNVVSHIYLMEINIESKDKNYTLLKFSNQKVFCKFIIIHFLAKDIKNKQPLNTIYTIYTDVTKIEIFNMKIMNTYSINLLSSASSSLLMQHFYIYNIGRELLDYSSFIMHKSPSIIYEIETLQIFHFEVNYFEGIFISAYTDNIMYAVLSDLIFNEPISTQEFIQFKSQIVSKLTSLQIHRVSIKNQIYIKKKQQKAFIETNYDYVTITIIYLEDIYQQVLRTCQSRYILIIGVYVNQYYFNDSVLRIMCDALSSSIKISQFTIYNSSIDQGSFFDFSLKGYHLIFDNIRFIDLLVDNSLFKLVSPQDYQIKFSNIIVESVTSYKYLFQISSQVNYFTTSLIRVITPQIFSSNNKKIGYINGLITSIREKCLLSQNSLIYLNQSEIVNSNIIQHQDQIIRYQSQYLDMFSNVNQKIMIFFSLNRGKSLFNHLQIYDNVYQTQFSKNNSYLYLPSGRDVQGYQYFNFAKREYTRLYDSISYVSLYQAQTTQCILKQMFNNETIQQQDLLLQPGVNQVDNLTFTLNPYNKDKHIELDLICNQNESKITYRTLIKTFNCQLGEFLFKDQCILCNIEYSSYSVGYNQQYCLMKDSNIIEKLNVGQIKLYETYWRHSYANKYIEQCKNQNCLGGWHTGDHSCKIGYVGALCSECDVYNVRGQGSFGKIDNQCSLCYFDYSIYLKGMLIILFQLLLIYISQNTNQQLSQQFLFMRISKRKFTDILQRQNINQVTVLFKLYFNYIFTIYLLKESIEFGQVVDLSLNMVYNPSFIAVPQFDCLIYSLFQYPIQYTQLIIKILLPISLLNFVVIIYALMIKFQASNLFADYSSIALISNSTKLNQIVITYQIFQYILDFREPKY